MQIVEIVAGIGREGSEWFSHICKEHDIETKNTNFALLVSKNFTEPFKSPLPSHNRESPAMFLPRQGTEIIFHLKTLLLLRILS